MTITILCVDDSTDDTLLLRRACRRAGVKFVLQSVDDGDPIPTLVLLDLKMPTKTGFEVLEWLRKQPAYRSLPVAVFTSSHQESDIRDAYLKGADCFLTKPIDYRQLVELVKALEESFKAQQSFPDPLRQLPVFKPAPGKHTGL